MRLLLGACNPSTREVGEVGRAGDQPCLYETLSQNISKNKTKEGIVGNSKTVMDTANIK